MQKNPNIDWEEFGESMPSYAEECIHHKSYSLCKKLTQENKSNPNKTTKKLLYDNLSKTYSPAIPQKIYEQQPKTSKPLFDIAGRAGHGI